MIVLPPNSHKTITLVNIEFYLILINAEFTRYSFRPQWSKNKLFSSLNNIENVSLFNS